MKKDTKDTTNWISKRKKTKENTIDRKDRFSLLPDFIVHHILSYLLDDPKSRVRMSVLYKGWFTLTATFPILYFRQDWNWVCSFSRKYDDKYIKEKFYKYVEHTVFRFCEQNISAHTLNISSEIIDFKDIELFEYCLDLVLEKGLQMMDIQFAYFPGNRSLLRLPNTLLSASSLTSLTLHKCELPSFLMVGVVKFKSLRLLSLSHLPVDEGVIEYLTNGCPLLEEIYLGYCHGFKTFCVKRHHNLLKVEIYCDERLLLERIDVDAPHLSYFLLESNKGKAPSMFLGSCKKLTTFCYRGSLLERFNDFVSDFPFLENVSLNLSSSIDNLKLSHHFLRRLILQSDCDLEKVDLNAPNLVMFEYCDRINFHNFASLSIEDSSLSKGCLKCETAQYFDILWFEKLRNFLEKNSIYKVLKLVIHRKKHIDIRELKLIHSPPYELEHVELDCIRETRTYVTLIEAVLWCCRPRSLTLELDHFTDKGDVVEYTYMELLEQEDEGQINISFSKDEQHFSDLKLLLKALSLDQLICKITFTKEEVVQEAG